MTMINIRRDETTGKVSFDPPTVQVLPEDLVFWANHDPRYPHQPTPKGQAPDRWLTDPIPAAEPGQPVASSPAISLATPATPDADGVLKITYVDGLDHADGAEGELTF